MDVTMLLCDFAESLNGKLYIMGGGWSGYNGPNPVDCALGIRIGVPWNETNTKHAMVVQLVDQDNNPVVGPDGKPFETRADIEVGRPPGAIPGSEIVNTFAVTFKSMPLPSNQYKVAFLLDDKEIASTSFHVNRPAKWRAPNDE